MRSYKTPICFLALPEVATTADRLKVDYGYRSLAELLNHALSYAFNHLNEWTNNVKGIGDTDND